jgi:DNA gyrase/topoisomerase IV subunit B
MNAAPYQSFSSVLIRALVAYSVHEHGNEGGTARTIRLALQRRGCILEDDGRGIGLHREGYVTGLVEQLAVRHGEVALHGLGLALIAMSSPSMLIESRREGQKYSQNFSWGVAQGGVQAEPWQGPSGTRIAVALPESAAEVDVGEVTAQIQLWRSAYPDLQIEIAQGHPNAF